MEQSPVVIAWDHARNAANAPDPAAARIEHEHAARQFALAAKATKHPEAIRTLKLLEQHHQKLAQLFKFPAAHPLPSPNPQNPIEQTPTSHVSISNAQQPRDASSYKSQPQTVTLPQRDISSSIASNLASARGIPSNRQRRSQPSQAPNPPRRSKLVEETYQIRTPQPQKLPSVASVSPPSSAQGPSTAQPPSTTLTSIPTTSKSDEPFQRFYSTFESLFSRLSAPLAFAGLPLNPDEPPPPSTPQHSLSSITKPALSRDRTPATKPPSSRRALEASQRASADPDYSALFSRAALRAVADEHGPGSVGANESFYVVPTSGHTLAYADILARQHLERNRDRPGIDHGEEDDDFEGDEELFVDARETPGPPSPEVNRKRGQQRGGKVGTKTMEELQLENEAMKALLDQTSRRLLEFEMSAQSSSVALQRSIRQLNVHSADAAGSGNKETEEKLRAMEEQVLARMKEMAKVERENEKLKGVVGRYRDRFEAIKAGARARREETRGQSEEG
ncbi:MAG: hypothetical protein LQ338_002264 [Usnochroma carphineum]|nr:MAG: hypothetical protein LQ338_002264 [Usnochroma carphineum]